MSRNYLLIAGGVLLAAAAVMHLTAGPRNASQTDVATGFPTGEEQDPNQAALGHPLVDPLVPPIRIEGLNDGLYHPGRLGEGPNVFDPDSLVGQIAASSDFSAGSAASFHAHGEEVCASGCAASNHPTKELTRAHFHELLDQYAQEPMDESSFALESLLYYGRQTQALVRKVGDWPLDPLRSDFLREQLQTTHAKVEIRLVDEHGEIRTWLPPTRVPFDRRHEFDMQVNNVQPLITSGTVKRVGLYHLWTRL